MLRYRVLAAALIFSAALTWFFTPLRSTAQSMWNGFIRDSVGDLSVNIRSYSVAAQTITQSANITSATTTQIIGPVATATNLWWVGAQLTGNNSSDTVQFEFSSVAGCASNATTFTPVGQQLGSTAGLLVLGYGGSMGNANQQGAISPANIPFQIPAGTYVCVVTAGTTISVQAIILSTPVL